MLKIIGLITLVMLCGFIGTEQALKLSNRSKFLDEFSEFISYIKVQVRSSCNDIINIIISFREMSCTNKLNFLQYISTEGIDFHSAWEQSVNEIPKTYGLKKEDISLIKKFGFGLGLSDIEGELSHCDLYFGLIAQKQKEALQEKQKKIRLYPILGFSIGICVALVLV